MHNRRSFQSQVVVITAFVCTASNSVAAQTVDAPTLKDEWKLESIQLTNDIEYRGLVLSESMSMVEFASLIRRPGRSMFTVVMGIKPDRVKKIVRLQGDDRKRLVQRYEVFKNRVPIMLGRMEELSLATAEIDGTTTLTYEGDWFRLTSTANDEMTRRCIVRIEQMLRAFRQLLPPRLENARRFDIRLFGSGAEYRRFLSKANLSIDNPAFYSTSRNMIVAGSELTRFSQRLDLTRRHNEETRRRSVAMEKQFNQRKLQLSRTYLEQGLSSQQIKTELNLQTAVWMVEKTRLLDSIAEADRRNTARFSAVTEEMFRRLYHEAFHAYLETHVFPSTSHHVPRWLNEGLAQVFEGGQLDGEMLRIDAPHRERLKHLQDQLASGSRPEILKMLQAGDRFFLTSHESNGSSTSYKLSWGVAYYLLFEQQLLGSDRLTAYVASDARQRDPQTRFEGLVGMPLQDFTDEWLQWLRSQK